MYTRKTKFLIWRRMAESLRRFFSPPEKYPIDRKVEIFLRIILWNCILRRCTAFRSRPCMQPLVLYTIFHTFYGVWCCTSHSFRSRECNAVISRFFKFNCTLSADVLFRSGFRFHLNIGSNPIVRLTKNLSKILPRSVRTADAFLRREFSAAIIWCLESRNGLICDRRK